MAEEERPLRPRLNHVKKRAGSARGGVSLCLSPLAVGLSHMEIPESLPWLGSALHLRDAYKLRKRIENKTESNREERATPLERVSSQVLSATSIFPYAIALPLAGRGRSPDGAQRNPGTVLPVPRTPDFAALHPGYKITPPPFRPPTARTRRRSRLHRAGRTGPMRRHGRRPCWCAAEPGRRRSWWRAGVRSIWRAPNR